MRSNPLKERSLAAKELFLGLRLPIEHLAQFPPIPILGSWQTPRARVDRTSVPNQGRDIASSGENDHLRRKVGHLCSEVGQTAQFTAQEDIVDAPLPLALNVPPFAAGIDGLDRHNVAPFPGGARPPVPMYCIELTAIAGKPIDQTLKIVRREALEGIRSPGGRCKALKPGQVLPPARSVDSLPMTNPPCSIQV